MTKKELQERYETLKARYQSVQGTLNLEEKQEKLEELNTKMEEPKFWDTPDTAKKISQSAAHTTQTLALWKTLEAGIRDLPELIEISEENELNEVEQELQTLETAFTKAETDLLLSGPYDTHNAIISIHVGTGGQDAEDFCRILQRMYLRWAEQNSYTTTIIDESPSDAGLKSCTIEISGSMAYGMLKGEHGVHRLIRLSPFNAKSLRQTSFAQVEILPEIENDTEIEIDEKDIRVDVFRSGGAGGQSVNTTDSAVRITYLPLNLVVTCQNERSQLQNKETALKVLKSRLAQLKIEQQAEALTQLRGDKLDANFGSQIRTYTLQPYQLAKDHRTNHEEGNVEAVLNGHLEGFMQAWLRH